jgi:HK97 family phage major capsid protein
MLVNGLLKEAGAIEQVGDSRATTVRKELYPIWLGQPTASFVGESGVKPVTGAELGQTSVAVKKVSTIVPLTDEFVEDLQYGEFTGMLDGGVRVAIRDVIDANIVGKAAGTNISTNFDNALRATTSTVEIANSGGDRLRLAVSAAMGTLEANGYGDRARMGVIMPADVPQHIRDARTTFDATTPVYQDSDPFYGLPVSYSTNLNTLAAATSATSIVGFVVYRPNLHLRIRKDVTVAVTNEAVIFDGTSTRLLWQQDEQAMRWVVRVGFMFHDANRAVVSIINQA